MTDDGDRLRLLSDAARAAIGPLFAVGRHEIAAAVSTVDGTVVTGVNLKATVGRASVCAESVAVANVVMAGLGDIVAGAAFIFSADASGGLVGRLVSPCGPCRELLSDFAPGMTVHLSDGQHDVAVPVRELLPHKYVQI